MALDNNQIKELFESIKLIAKSEINKVATSDTIKGKIIERIHLSDSYRISYMNTEITAVSMGSIYAIGDEVYILLPKGTLGDNKFILGKTNNRTPTISFTGGGASDSTLQELQDILDIINDMTSDNMISPSEKQNLYIQWEQIQKSYNETLELVKPYSDIIDTSELTSSFNSLKAIFDVVFIDMETSSPVNGQMLRDLLNAYLTNDTNIRLLVQEELRKELLYNVDIVSSNGESFKNNIINTLLYVIVRRGKSLITNELNPTQIIWNKIKDNGSIISGWEKNGIQIPITSDDIDTKQIFRVTIKVEDAIVAQDDITIVDLNDIDNINLSLETLLSKTQIYQPATKKIIPNYEEQSQVITALVRRTNDEVTTESTFKWFYNDEEIITDSRFEVNKNILKIKKNLTDAEYPNYKIKCSVTYFSTENNINLEDFQEIDFSFISDGENGQAALNIELLHPLGTIIRNEELLELKAEIIAFLGDEDITKKISKRKWFYEDSSIGPSSPFYDPDGGEGWSLIGDLNNLRGNLIGYNSNILTIQREGIQSILTLKVIGYYEDGRGITTTTLFDLLDPLNVVILGSGLFIDEQPNILSVDVFMGQKKIEDPESKYNITWNLMLKGNPTKIRAAGWPKTGKVITVLPSELPDNDDLSIKVDITRK